MGLISEIIKERTIRPFTDITDFITRLSGRDINKRAVEYLIKAGAFDSFGFTRKGLLSSYEDIYDSITDNRNRNLDGQMGFFDFIDDSKSAAKTEIKNIPEFDSAQLMKLEKEALGYYATGHPLDSYDQYIRLNEFTKISEITDSENRKVKDGEKIRILAMLSGKKLHTTKSGRTMCFAAFEDVTGQIEGIIFDDVYGKSVSMLSSEDRILILYGTVSASDNAEEQSKIIINQIETADTIKPTEYKTLFINLKSNEQDKIFAVSALISRNCGKEQVRLCFSDTRKVVAMNGAANVNITKELLTKLSKICGKGNIILK